MESIRLQPTYNSAAERKTTYISYHAKCAMVKRGKGKERERMLRKDDSMIRWKGGMNGLATGGGGSLRSRFCW